jgi:hypothetical protein
MEWRWGLAEPGCFCVLLTLRANDPMLRAWQEGRLKQAEEPTECVMLHEWVENPQPNRAGHFRPLNLGDYGATGIRMLLERGNTWSGRGEFRSLNEAVQAVHRKNIEQQTKYRAEQRAAAVDVGREVRRQVHQIPLHSAGIDLKQETH